MNPRKSVTELELSGSRNLRRSLSYPSVKVTTPAKLEELEQLWEDLTERRKIALADIKKRGLTIMIEKYSSRGALYLQERKNPNLEIVQACERQLAQLAKMLPELPEAASPAPDEPQPTDILDELLRRND